MKKAVFCLSILILLGCAKSEDSKRDGSPAPAPAPLKTDSQGVADFGGGDILLSSEEEVNTAIDNSLALINEMKEDTDTLLVMNASDSKSELFKKVIYKNEQENMAVYLAKSKIDRKKTGACQGDNDRHTSASVSQHKLGADICLSIEKLRVTVAASLEPQIISLLAHETAHLLGYGEEEAISVQKEIYNRMLPYQVNLSWVRLRDDFLMHVIIAKFAFKDASQGYESHNDKKFYMALGHILATLNGAPGVNTDYPTSKAIEKRANPTLKAGIKNIRTAVAIIIQFLTDKNLITINQPLLSPDSGDLEDALVDVNPKMTKDEALEKVKSLILKTIEIMEKAAADDKCDYCLEWGKD
jgi:hypothetical protein